MSISGRLRLAGGAGILAVMAGAMPAEAAISWYGSRANFLAASPLASDPTGMSAVTTDAQAIALMENPASAWRNNVDDDQKDITLGRLTISNPQGPIASHGFGMNIDGSTPASSVGFTGAVYAIGNPANENHSYLIDGTGAVAFGLSIFEPRGLAQCGGVPCVVSRFTFEAFDVAGLSLGTHVIDFGNDAETRFVGLTSTTAFARLSVTETRITGGSQFGCCVYDNEYFGNYLMTTADAVTRVPEPASWAMMIGGFGAIGVAMRRGRMRMARVAFH